MNWITTKSNARSKRNMMQMPMMMDLDAMLAGLRSQIPASREQRELLERSDDLYDSLVVQFGDAEHKLMGVQVDAFYGSGTFKDIILGSLLNSSDFSAAVLCLTLMSFRAGIRFSEMARREGITIFTGLETKEPS